MEEMNQTVAEGAVTKKGSAQIIPAFLDYYVFLEL